MYGYQPNRTSILFQTNFIQSFDSCKILERSTARIQFAARFCHPLSRGFDAPIFVNSRHGFFSGMYELLLLLAYSRDIFCVHFIGEDQCRAVDQQEHKEYRFPDLMNPYKTGRKIGPVSSDDRDDIGIEKAYNPGTSHRRWQLKIISQPKRRKHESKCIIPTQTNSHYPAYHRIHRRIAG